MHEANTLTVEEVAERLGCSVATVKRKARLLGGEKVTAGWKFSPVRVAAFAKAAKHEAA